MDHRDAGNLASTLAGKADGDRRARLSGSWRRQLEAEARQCRPGGQSDEQKRGAAQRARPARRRPPFCLPAF